jgi:phosphoribosyl 1,2-cyclic phosphodiesterase
MKVVDVIASGSSGNCVVLNDGQSQIVFDAGLPYSKLAQKVQFSKVSGVFITHEHGDHIKAVPELVRRGLSIHMSEGTRNSKGVKPHEVVTMKDGQVVESGSWLVRAFNVFHDAAEPLGFLAASKHAPIKAIYIADSAYIPYKFPGITHFIVEANYAEDIMDGRDINPMLARRIRNSHFSLDSFKQFIERNVNPDTQEIHMIHLSNLNSDVERFIKEVTEITGVPVYA